MNILTYCINHSPLLYLTQSLWRDEAYSILVAERSPAFFFGNLTFEPPLYYLLLHVWIRIVGTSEIAVRSLSLVGFALATVVVIIWSEKLLKQHWLRWFLPVLFFFNPMLLYYAFEARTYGWYMFFSILSLYAYATRRWKLYLPAAVLGFYTHTFMIIVPFVQAIHYAWTNPKVLRIKTLVRDPFVRSLATFALCITPWMVLIMKQAGSLAHSWYFPVDLHLIVSVLGNMFIGYEGTPWYGWSYTRILSLIILAFSLFALKQKATRKFNSLFFLMIYVPLIFVIGISFIKPLFVNRYMMPVAQAEVILIVLAIAAMKRPWVQKLVAGTWLIAILAVNAWYPAQHAKTDIRRTMREVNALKTKTDVIYAETPLIFFETLYYSDDRSAVYLFNPDDNPFPQFVGSAVFPADRMIADIPRYPRRAFLIHKNGTFDIVYSAHVNSLARTKPR